MFDEVPNEVVAVKKKKKAKANKHTAKMTVASPLDLTKANIEFEVRRDGRRFGTLFISRGAVAWKPRSGKQNYKFTWSGFDYAMQWGTKTHGK
jgi:hypothetical protein